ncbi:MAG: peptide ABC transporter substrate-binding protein [Alphaproteobacteria bacterium]|nr:peptide ABC transporter substrate-binding protein [Alphaproteobacteria bacterium]
MIQRLLLAFALAAFALVSAAPPHALAMSELKRGNTSEPDSLDPHKVTGQWENNLIVDLFVGLMTFDAKGEPIPGAAESYTVSDDGLTYTFTIREGHVWSDGVPVTADDFVYALRRINDPKTAAQYASLTFAVKNAEAVNAGEMAPDAVGARAIDPRTLEITLAYPAPYFLQLLTHYTMYPVPKHIVEAEGKDWSGRPGMVSNGPYTLDEWVPNDHIRLVKNPLFYDAANVALDAVSYFPTTDGEAALKQFRASELDLNNDLPISQLEWLRDNLPDAVRIHPFMLTTYVVFNLRHPPFDDVRVRRALTLAIDRDLLNYAVLKGIQVPAMALVPPGIHAYPGTARIQGAEAEITERRETARALLAEAGFGPDKPLRANILFSNTADNRRIVVALQDMWRKIGVIAEPQGSESRIHYTNLRTGNFDIGWAGWIADYNDARNFLFLAETRSGQMNYAGYSNPAFDALVAEGDRTSDPVARGAILTRAEQMLLDDLPMAPVYFGTSRNLLHMTVRGWVDNVVDIHPTRFLDLKPWTGPEREDTSPDAPPKEVGWWGWFMSFFQ